MAVAVLCLVVLSTTAFAERATDRAELMRLADVYETRTENRRTLLYYRLLASTDPAVQSLNDNPDIQLMYIDKNGRPVYYITENLDAARTVGVIRVWPGGGAGYNLTGSGTLNTQLAVWDGGGVRLTHQEFGGRVIQVDVPAVTSPHATHVAGTMVAAGFIPASKGMSYEAGLAAYDWNYDLSEMAAAAAAGLQVSNHSYGEATGWRYDSGDWYWFGDITVDTVEDYRFGFYAIEARDLDEIAFNAPAYLIVQSAGNDRNDVGPGPGGEHWVLDGTWVTSFDTRDPDGGLDGFDCVPGKKTAKNILTVGAVNDIPLGYTQPSDVVQTDFSSWGPADDGRIKPDIVANGTGLYSCSDAGDDQYTTMGGTSMAAPSVAGAINLLVRHYESVMGAAPRAATMKGIVIQTAHEAGDHDGPDYANGWGLLNTEGAADLIQNFSPARVLSPITPRVLANAPFASGAPSAPPAPGSRIIERTLREGVTDNYSFTLDTLSTVKLTIAWTDIPGETPSASVDPRTAVLINDLDVRIEHVQSATVYEPWILDYDNPADSAATGDNTVDNVEQVFVAVADSGDYWVRVTHKGSLVHGAPWNTEAQDYSLLCSEAVTYMPSYRHYVSKAGSSTIPYDTPAKAANTISKALAIAEVGDSVFVEMNTFNELSLSVTEGVLLSGGWGSLFTVRDPFAGQTIVNIISPLDIDSVAAPVVIDGFVFQGGVGTYGGGLRVDNSDLTLRNCLIHQNQAHDGSYGYGGGIYAFESTIHLVATNVSSNSAGRGGGIYLEGCIASIDSSTISNNNLVEGGVDSPDGGGIYIVNSTSVTLSGNLITGNAADASTVPEARGGGIYVENTPGLSMNGDVVSYNTTGALATDGYGGGIHAVGSSLTLSTVDISRNTARTEGGGVYTDTGSSVSLSKSRVMWNAAGIGGGLYLSGPESSVEHNLFVGNDSTACYLTAGSTGSFVGNTLDRNVGLSAGGAFFLDTAIPVFNNVIVNSDGPGIKCNGPATPALSHNNVWNNSGGDYDGCAPGIGSVSADPFFADTSLVDYHLTLHSPSIDAGDPDPGYNDPDGSRGDIGWLGSHVFNMDYPEYPKDFEVAIVGSDAVLSWSANPEPDVEFYAVYKDTVANFIPSDSSFVMLVAAPDTTFNDGPASYWTYYVISAVDTSGYASGYAAAAQVDPTGIGREVASYTDRLDQNYPNPFNPTTRIGYQLRSRVPVSLNVYDVGGRLVRRLVDGDQGPGNFTVEWDGRNMHGATVSTGVYFYRFAAGSFIRTKKMVMLK